MYIEIMWFNETELQQLGLQEVHRPRWEYEGWAHSQLPETLEYYRHPFCKTLETALFQVVSRSLEGLTPLFGVNTSRYKWIQNHIETIEDPVKKLLYFDNPGGHAFIGSYRHDLFAYSYPAIGYTTRADECIPILYYI